MVLGDAEGGGAKMATKGKNAHLLFVTIAFSGHFAPFVQLLYHLEAKRPGLTVTVMGNTDRIAEVHKLQSKGDLSKLDLRLEPVFGAMPVYAQDPKFPVRPEPVSHNNLAECLSLRTKLIAEKDLPGGPTVVVSDMFLYWAKVSSTCSCRVTDVDLPAASICSALCSDLCLGMGMVQFYCPVTASS